MGQALSSRETLVFCSSSCLQCTASERFGSSTDRRRVTIDLLADHCPIRELLEFPFPSSDSSRLVAGTIPTTRPLALDGIAMAELVAGVAAVLRLCLQMELHYRKDLNAGNGVTVLNPRIT